MKKVKIGIIGCGNIFKAYANGCRLFEILDLVACADIDMAKAEERAIEFNVPARTVAQLLADREIEIVVNLTVPNAHAEVNLQILAAGKHAYTEKPFATRWEDAEQVLRKAKAQKLLVGSAPDTFLGGGGQTCRKLLDDGWIGRSLGMTAFVAVHGMEHWHPNPEFFYKRGGGPMLDIGPYYLTALVNLLGPIKRVCGFATISFPERIVTSHPNFGQRIVVETPTHYTGAIEFASGVTGVIITSFDVWKHNLPRLEIYGTEGTLSVPDPNTFGGPVKLYRPGNDPGMGDFMEMPLSHLYTENTRSIGVADMAYAIRTGRKHRACGEMAAHVLEVMLSFAEASASGKYVDIQSTCERPTMLPVGLRYGTLDE
jgi:predicted dehydrogenase